MNTPTKKETNYNTVKLDIKRTITTTLKGEPFVINIRLSDDCNNGHNDFAITGELYEKTNINPYHEKQIVFNGKKHVLYACGCLHDEILKARPDLKIFVDLHLSDENGLPMYAIENGYYHFCKDIKVFSNYMRVSIEDAKELRGKVFTKLDFTFWIGTQIERYKKEAKAARELLEFFS